MRDAPKTAAQLALSNRLGLTIGEAAASIGVSERHLRTALPEIPHLHVGRRVVIPVDSLREWLRSRAAAEQSDTARLADQIIQSLDTS